jgi:hypothetical protein
MDLLFLPSAITGKLLNTRPRRNIALHGVANYVVITVHPSCSAAVVPPPTEWVFEGLLHAFQTFYKIDSLVKWFPTYDAEPAEKSLPHQSTIPNGFHWILSLCR